GEVERLDLPATAEINLQIALALQAIQRLAHRRAAGGHALGDLALAEAITGQQAELEDVVLELQVDALGEILRALLAALGRADQLHVRPPRSGSAEAGHRPASPLCRGRNAAT